MLPDMDVKYLDARRKAIRRELASVGDLRPGSLFERYEIAASRAATAPARATRGTGRTGC